MLSSTLLAPPESGRPSDGSTIALVAGKSAWVPDTNRPVASGPGTLCTVALTRTSTRGIVYELSILNCVSQFSVASHHGLPTGSISGSAARISQLFDRRRPVLVPP